MTFAGEEQTRADLAAAHQMALCDGLAEGTWNHFSAMLDAERMLITPADRHWAQVTPGSLVLTASAGDVPELPEQFWIGYRIHAAVHEARPEAICALHVHPPYATALSLLEDVELIAASQISVDFAGRLAVSEGYDGLAGAAQGEAIAAALGGSDALILRGHGVVVVGPSVAQAYLDLYLLERACRVQVLALSTGRPIRAFGAEEVEALHHQDDPEEARRHFEAMRKMLGATGALGVD
jgi:ribulose-5-phosphate 4-epimerase/fuculose-1-phosphate aldolase